MLTGGWLITRLSAVFAQGFVFDRQLIEKPLLLPAHFGEHLLAGFVLVMPIIVFTMIAAVVASGITVLIAQRLFAQGGRTPPLEGDARFGPITLPFAETLRAGVEALEFPRFPGLRCSISLGLAGAPVGGELRDWMEAADQALYRAKHGGRNRVELATTPTST